ncbi:MAG TPA: hypothetical protein VEH50_13895 [Methylomirabilota bacterium]|nr:hypothetical protein [Methylomirabilota bacterium]
MVVRGTDLTDAVGGITLSEFTLPSVSRNDYTPVKIDFRGWKTPEGIGLGSTEANVRAVYGPPAGEQALTVTRAGVASDEKKIFYEGPVANATAEMILGVRNGRITSIELRRTLLSSGPDCVGPICTDMDVSEASPRALRTAVSPPLTPQARTDDFYCLQSVDKTFLRLELSLDSSRVLDLVLSDISTCNYIRAGAVQVTATDLKQWRTPEGIGLGSSVDDVIRVYGKPLNEYVYKQKDLPGMFPGFKAGDKVPDIGTEVLSYQNDIYESVSFAIRDGKVCLIRVWQNE